MHRPLANLAAIALLVAACGSNQPSPSPTLTPTSPPASPTPSAPQQSSRPAAEVYAEIRTEVQAIRGLDPTASVEPVSIDEATLRTNISAEFDASYTAQQLKDTEDLLITLGLLPAGSSLKQLTLDFQAGQVAGYYSPEKDELFVVSRSGRVGPVGESTYAHEFTHQLQDQHFDLDALGLDATDQSDRSLAHLGLVEGDAVSVQTTMFKTFTEAELGEILAAGLDPKALEALNNAPPYLRDTALFPYSDGAAFVSRLIANGGYNAVDAAFEDPPDSTEQVLHPEKYLTREPPTAVKISAGVAGKLGAGWSEAGQDTLGELILRIWLRQAGVTAAVAKTAAAGWGGDRLVLLRGPAGALSVGLLTTWDTATDADEFAAAATTAQPSWPGGGQINHVVGSKTVAIAIGVEAAKVLAAISG